MEKLRCRKIKEQTRDHTTRHLHTWELDLDLLTRVVSDILQEDDTEGLLFSLFLVCKFKVQCFAFSDSMKHCTEKFEGTCQKMYSGCLEIQTANYMPRENKQSVLFGFIERKYL